MESSWPDKHVSGSIALQNETHALGARLCSSFHLAGGSHLAQGGILIIYTCHNVQGTSVQGHTVIVHGTSGSIYGR